MEIRGKLSGHKIWRIGGALLVAGVGGFAVTNAAVGVSHATSNQQRLRPHKAAHNSALAPISPTISTTGATACGSWGDDLSPTNSTSNGSPPAADPTVSEFDGTYGGIAGCGLTGNTWVIFTAGIASEAPTNSQTPPPAGATYSQNPGIAVYSCSPSDSACFDPATSHPFSSWSYVASPTPGFLHLIGNPYPGTIIVDVEGLQEIFNTTTMAFTTQPTSVMGQCARAWGSSGGTAASSTEAQLTFFSQNPECVSGD